MGHLNASGVCPPWLRIVILDYPKLTLNDENAKRIFGQIMGSRQVSFRRTLETYLALDKHDMIGTHILVYDSQELYFPQILSGIRLTYSSRCGKHGLQLPLDENILCASLPTQKFYQDFKSSHSEIAECNAWFVDSNFSYAKTHLDLAQIIFFTLTTYLLRQGISSFTGATNERFKGSRWVSKVGEFEEGHTFTHPAVPDPHKVTLVPRFRNEWLIDCFEKFGPILQSRYEVVPESMSLKTLDEVEREIRAQSQKVSKVS